MSITPRGLRIDGRERPLVSGSVHYWRLEPDRWEHILDAVASLGIRIVETYVPWSVHERAPHHFDFGDRDRRLDIGRFLDLIEARGLKALVRPGPHINSELTDFGFPARVLADPRVQARTARRTPAFLPLFPRPFPVPSYASEAFLDEVAGWFTAVMPVLLPRLHPDGPIVAVQVDNELCSFFRTSLYDLDYCDDALAGYRRFLRERYGDVGALNRAYGTRHGRIDAVHPPRRFDRHEPLRYHLDWARHQTWAHLEALRRIKALMDAHLSRRVPLFTNLPPNADTAPFDLGAIEEVVEQVGLDLYYTRRQLPEVRRSLRSLSAQTRLPSCPEFGAGSFLTFFPTLPEDNREACLAAFMYGLRSANFYMCVDRERWYGAPLRSDGRRREPLAGFYRRLLEIVERYQLASRPRVCQVAIMRGRLYDQLAAISTLVHPVPPLVLQALGRGPSRICPDDGPGALAIAHEKRLTAWQEALSRASVDYDLADSSQRLELLERYRLVLAPSLEAYDREAADRLLALARAGAWVVLGPGLPRVDLETGATIDWPFALASAEPPAMLRPPDYSGEGWQAWTAGQGAVVLASDPISSLPPLLNRAGIGPTGVWGVGSSPYAIQGVRLPATEDSPELIWVMNEAPDPQVARIEGARALTDLFSGDEVTSDQGRIDLPIEGRSVRLFELLPERRGR